MCTMDSQKRQLVLSPSVCNDSSWPTNQCSQSGMRVGGEDSWVTYRDQGKGIFKIGLKTRTLKIGEIRCRYTGPSSLKGYVQYDRIVELICMFSWFFQSVITQSCRLSFVLQTTNEWKNCWIVATEFWPIFSNCYKAKAFVLSLCTYIACTVHTAQSRARD